MPKRSSSTNDSATARIQRKENLEDENGRNRRMPLRSFSTWLLFVMTTWIVVVEASSVDNVLMAATKPTHPFMNVETSCSTGDALLIVASFQEPFYGLLYADGYAKVPSCRASGSGSRLLRLALNASECGINYTQSDDGSRQLDLSLYLQYDSHVQQAVDEQMTTRCILQKIHPVDPSSNEVRSSAGLDKIARSADASDPIKLVLPYRSSLITNSLAENKTSGLPITSYQAKKMEMNRDAKISSPPASMITSGVLKLNHGPAPSPLPSPPSSSSSLPQQETVSCWMDIVAGSDPLGKPVETFLRVGQDATIVVRVRQTGGLDSRLTACSVHDGSHEVYQELLDSDGCTLDSSILPSVQERVTSRSTGVVNKILYANFQAFRFPDRDHLHLKCTVVVCKGKCLMNSCNLIRRKGRTRINRVQGSTIIPPGSEGRGQLGSIRQLTSQEMSEASIRPIASPSLRIKMPNEGSSSSTLINRNGSTRSSNLTSHGTIVDRVDVFNSVEVRVSTAPTSYTDESKPFKSFSSRASLEAAEEPYDEEAIFCLTPSKLFMAFGILFAVLISAMLFAVCVCIRIRISKQEQTNSKIRMMAQQQQRFGNNPYSSPQPRYINSSSPRSSQHAMAALNPACLRGYPSSLSGSRHQLHVNRHSPVSPYIRIFK